MIVIRLAELPIGIDNRYEYVERLAADYLTDQVPLFTVSASDGDIEKERTDSGEEFNDGYLESIVVYRKIAEIIPRYNAFVFHGAVLNYSGKAYAFTARSGVGKTTHAGLWISEFNGAVHYLNGDKPIIRIIDGKAYAYGTPWRGKERYGVNESAPLEGIAFLERAKKNTAEVIDPAGAILKLVTQIYLPKDSEMLKQTMKLINGIISSVRFIELKCNMDPEAAHVAKKALVN